MKVLVCGGRDFFDVKYLNVKLAALHIEHHFTLLIHGGQRGADRLAQQWAKASGVPEQEFKADWERYRKAAGPIRNEQMLREAKPDMVVAFPGGSGTAHMVRIAKAAGLPVIEITLFS